MKRELNPSATDLPRLDQSIEVIVLVMTDTRSFSAEPITLPIPSQSVPLTRLSAALPTVSPTASQSTPSRKCWNASMIPLRPVVIV